MHWMSACVHTVRATLVAGRALKNPLFFSLTSWACVGFSLGLVLGFFKGLNSRRNTQQELSNHAKLSRNACIYVCWTRFGLFFIMDYALCFQLCFQLWSLFDQMDYALWSPYFHRGSRFPGHTGIE